MSFAECTEKSSEHEKKKKRKKEILNSRLLIDSNVKHNNREN